MSPKRPRTCLVSVHGTGNILAAMAAVRHFGEARGASRPTRVVTLVHPPTDSRDAAQDSGAVIERLIGSQGWDPPIVLTIDETLALTEGAAPIPYAESLRRFRELTGNLAFDEVYYAHDFVNRVPELMMNAFPRAERITFGDSLGFVFNSRYLVAQVVGATKQEAYATAVEGERSSSPRGLRGLAKWMRGMARLEPRPLQARTAALILPMDHTGDYLADKQLLVVPKQVVTSVIADCQSTLPEMNEYSRQLLARPGQPYLVLLENDVEAGTMSFDDAVRMYEAAVRRNAPAGASVLIKPHPLAVEPVHDALSDRLRPDYASEVISGDLMRIPLELWKTLLDACEVISPLSSCYVSLSYLYGKEVILTSGKEWIEEFYPAHTWEYMLEVDERYREMVRTLATWDARSVLWRGSFS